MLGQSGGIGLYASELQPGLLTEADAFYASDGIRGMAGYDVPQYLAHADVSLRTERDRVNAYLEPGLSMRPLISIVEQRLIAAHATALLERGFNGLLDQLRTEDLGRFYSLLGRVRRIDDLRRCFADRTKARFMEIVAEKDEEKDKGIVAALLEYKASMDRCACVNDACHFALGQPTSVLLIQLSHRNIVQPTCMFIYA